MKIKDYDQMMQYLTRREPSAEASKGAFKEFVKEDAPAKGKIAKEFSDTSVGKWIEYNNYVYAGGPKPKNFDAMRKETISTLTKPKKDMQPFVVKKEVVPVPINFDMNQAIIDVYEPVPEPTKAVDPDLDKGIAGILGVKGGSNGR